MPELPEVETVVRDLAPLLTNAMIQGVSHSDKKLRTPWKSNWDTQIVGRVIKQIRRRGKWIIFHLNDNGVILFHLGMTGQLQVIPGEVADEDHVHLVFRLDDNRVLRFRDIRRFGGATYFPSFDKLEALLQQKGLGPEPFNINSTYWREKLAGTSRNLKAVLLDQKIVAGVGNIYADESLFRAGLFPALKGCDLSSKAADQLRKAVEEVLEKAINKRGSTIRNYIGGSGLKGAYQDKFRVYGRTGKPCLICRTPVERIRLAGRSTHFCPNCQPDPDGMIQNPSSAKNVSKKKRKG